MTNSQSDANGAVIAPLTPVYTAIPGHHDTQYWKASEMFDHYSRPFKSFKPIDSDLHRSLLRSARNRQQATHKQGGQKGKSQR